MEAQGSDHAPAWADFELLQPLPTPEQAPLLSSRHLFTGELVHVLFVMTTNVIILIVSIVIIVIIFETAAKCSTTMLQHPSLHLH